jgi:hypothetical protein
MQPESKIPPPIDQPPSDSLPPVLSPTEPPVIGVQPPPLTIPSNSTLKLSPLPQLIVFLLSLLLGLFLADAILSLVDSSFSLVLGIHPVTGISALVSFLLLLLSILVYLLMALSPMIPKRQFLPVTLFNPLAGCLAIPFLIYFYNRFQQVAWVISLGQFILALGILYWLQGSLKLRWPLMPANRLKARHFSGLNLIVFVLVNFFVLLPALAVYFYWCTALAVGHFSQGFVALRPGGLNIQVRKYVRQDGKTVQLVPMSHIGEPEFYRQLSQSFPTNAIILMEGVSDEQHLLTNRISYRRAASSLGLAEQVHEFKPPPASLVRADVDVEQFSPATIDFLNLAMLLHAKGLNMESILMALQYSPPREAQEGLVNDLLHKRNRHLLDELQSHLGQADLLIVPWGAAHMPELAREIQKSGFRLQETHDYQAIRFGSAKHKRNLGIPKTKPVD